MASKDVEETAEAFANEKAERAFIVEMATTLGWKVQPTSGIGRPDMLLLGFGRIVAVWLRSRPMTEARARAWDAWAMSGATCRRWGRIHGPDIRKTLG